MKLSGTEVKSIRAGKAQLADAFARIEKGEVWLYGAYIEEYSHGGLSQHAPRRPRKLLLHAKEIDKLAMQVETSGRLIVALRMYFKEALVKVEIATASGKKQFDKREDLKKRETKPRSPPRPPYPPTMKNPLLPPPSPGSHRPRPRQYVELRRPASTRSGWRSTSTTKSRSRAATGAARVRRRPATLTASTWPTRRRRFSSCAPVSTRSASRSRFAVTCRCRAAWARA
ncbi:MAG: SsrA-binding protein SmpB [Lacunisphaera sp.]